jgi:hypothetical protein
MFRLSGLRLLTHQKEFRRSAGALAVSVRIPFAVMVGEFKSCPKTAARPSNIITTVCKIFFKGLPNQADDFWINIM